ncbi:SGNH/GDSL hydrolase family protein [Aspergillus clavatus NRRL 1]|uniref:GDSL-like lipase/acylhydrolase, putative n=1 Tax=Aspergillus clavatus (strain ATCC 1007 / CBS 513.65 / DSM 816 / NCTC 3887 / NRRL 1 / QM 1276 / 107) TaxID=344612 RepID=A1CMI9_ASPCL|nr:GDSL-like lipase/acylhydrolase, putative [Aspergillus clavatus NRRL 1]EAW08776.1 GDSL-like lipase/acylhydrolase, putative [Aspergillus clavatus NRRL 1]
MSDKLSILCFGNSLTAGYYHYGLEYHPYAGKLKEKLQAAFPSTKFTVDVEGLPGDRVISPGGAFLPRMQTKFSKYNYDWVIVLGGTNDLGYGFQPDTIYPALQATWQVPLEKDANVLAMTIPECALVSKPLNARRNAVNASILAHQAERFKIRYHGTSEEWQEKIWDDGLHLTAEGYDFMGEMIAERLIELIKAKKIEG